MRMNGIGEGGLCAIDRCGEAFAVADAVTGRVAVYDILPVGRRRDEFDGVSGLPTVVAVARYAGEGSAKSRKRARRKSAVDEEAILAAVGYSTGDVRVFSTNRADAVKVQEGSQGESRRKTSATAIVLSADASVLFMAAEDRSISSWKTSTGVQMVRRNGIDRSQVTSIAVSPDGRNLAIGSSKIYMLNSDTLETTRSFVGHASSVRALAFASDTLLYSGCEGDRHISSWDVDSPSEVASGSVVASAPAVSLCVDGKNFIAVLGVDATVSVFQTSKAKSAYATVRSQVLAMAMPRAGWLTVVHGSKHNPAFDSFQVDKGVVELETPSQKEQRKVSTSRLSIRDAVLNETKAAVIDGTPSVGDDKNAVKKGEKDDEDEDEEDMDDVTLEEKLAKIGVSTKTEEAASGVELTGGADSVVAVIAQALQTKDGSMLETALSSVRSKTSITSTVSKLPAESVVPFLSEISARIRTKPRRAAALSVWLRAVVTEHAGLLSSSGGANVSNTLTKLSDCIEERVRMHRRLAMLEGRLELVLAQADRVNKVASSGVDEDEPMVDYVAGEEKGTTEMVADEDGERSSDEDGISDDEEENQELDQVEEEGSDDGDD
mmetsp:Transcript_12358/g.37692  ORF Transcript_12358/g.37692 Transcript_12358/m.37692 type:complete len:605 (+) Transcript_12358:156-1970(+)